MNCLSDSAIQRHDVGCAATMQALFEPNGTVVCGHCMEAVLIPPYDVSGLTITCESGVGVWLLAGGELHRCHREVADEDIAELLDLEAGVHP